MLEEFGFVHSLELPGMAAEISTVLTQATDFAPLVIEKVTDQRKLDCYMQAFREQSTYSKAAR